MKMRAMALFVVLVLPQIAFTEAGTSSIEGVVIDSAGAVVSNASVQVTGKSTGTSATVKSDRNGRFAVQLLPADEYDVKVTARGFRQFTGTAKLAEAADKNVHAVLEICCGDCDRQFSGPEVILLEVWSSYGAAGFKLAVMPDGVVLFEDSRSGKKRKGHIAKAKLLSLLSAVEQAGFFESPECYGAQGLDGPGAMLGVLGTTKNARVYDYEMPPRSLRKPIELILDATKTRKWAREAYKPALNFYPLVPELTSE
jgi:hypothetical protein